MKIKLSFFYFLICTFSLMQLGAQTGKCIQGNCDNGSGTAVYKSLGTYVGSFQNQKREGTGIFTYTNGDIYEGSYKSDLRSGQLGKLTFANGDVFTGSFALNIGKGNLKDVYQNVIPGKLEADNRFVEDRIAYGNMIAKLKKSLVVLDSFRAENNNVMIHYPFTGFMVSNNKLCIETNGFEQANFITANLRFSDGSLHRTIRLNKIFQHPNRKTAIFQFADPVVPSFVLPLELETAIVMINSKVIAIGGTDLKDDEGTILSFALNQTAILEQIDPVITGKLRPMFNRSGHFIGIAESSMQNTVLLFTASDISLLQTAIGN